MRPLLLIAPLVVLTACGGSSSGGGSAPVTNTPRDGWVVIQGDPYTEKTCDGHRLVYEFGSTSTGGGIYVIDNAPECGGTPSPESTP